MRLASLSAFAALALVFGSAGAPLAEAQTIDLGSDASAPIAKSSFDEREGEGLEIRSDPPGAEVFIDGIYRGITPLSLRSLDGGTHFLLLSKEGYWSRRASLRIPTGKGLLVYLELPAAIGYLRIEAFPDQTAAAYGGAPAFEPAITVDGNSADRGDSVLAEGIHTVRVRAFGYEEETRTVRIQRGETETLRIPMRAAAFRIGELRTSRSRLNPRNPGLLGAVRLSFDATAAGRGRVSIRNPEGAEIFSAELPLFETWTQELVWDGRDDSGNPLPDGRYEAIAELRGARDEDPSATRRIQLSVDSGAAILPSSLSGDIGGYLYAPGARLIPVSSFEIATSLLAGRPFGSSTAFGVPPFSIGFRFSPAEGLELGGNMLSDASRDRSEALTIGASARKSLGRSTLAQLPSSAIAVRWAWSGSPLPSAFGPGAGIEASIPLEWRTASARAFSAEIVLAPGASWPGPDGIPEKGMPDPILAAALAVRGRAFVAALSGRASWRVGDTSIEAGPFLLGAEARFFPPPSLLVFSLLGGAWLDGSDRGAFLGGGLGFLY